MTFCVLDTETLGFYGPTVLIQYSDGFGPVQLHSVFKEPIDKTLELIEWMVNHPGGILGFNLSFDIYKLCQTWTTLRLLKDEVGGDAFPEDYIDTYAMLEPIARDGPCLKPVTALDLMLFARKGPLQSLMGRDDLVVKKVPKAIAYKVAIELERKVQLPEIFFAKRANRNAPKWQVEDVEESDGTVEFQNIVLRFAPSSALKALAIYELNLDPAKTLVFADVEIARKFLPKEHGFAPFALAIGRPGHWSGSWPDVVHHHISHWSHNELAREYAAKDIEYPRLLWEKWGRPAFGDDDSILACETGAAQHKGMCVNLKGLKAFREKAFKRWRSAPIAPRTAMSWISEVLTDIERLALTDEDGKPSTKRVVLEELVKQHTDDPCLTCSGSKADCPRCGGKGFEPTEGSKRASKVLDARKGKKEVELYDKLLLAQRMHSTQKLIGAKSGRSSGGQVTEQKRVKKSGSINPQAINKQKRIRAQFQLAFTKGMNRVQGLQDNIDRWASIMELSADQWVEDLWGGDFDKFEVCIADAYYEDPQLHEDLVGCEPSCDKNQCKGKCPKHKSGKEFGPPGSIKIHAVIGTLVYPGKSYWDIRMTDGQDPDLYTRAKSAFFALIYFGNAFTLATRLGIPVEDGEKAYQTIMKRYPVMAQKRLRFFERFCPLRQPEQFKEVNWVEPECKVESMLGFPRFFTLENQAIRAIYDLANDVPDEWRDIKVKVRRRERLQTVAGAVQSALFSAAFQIQGANMRAAGNHVIQSTGAGLTKMLQRLIWDVQPAGIHPWLVRPLNVHDELPTPMHRSVVDRVKVIQKAFILKYQSLIPLLAMRWHHMYSWAGK